MDIPSEVFGEVEVTCVRTCNACLSELLLGVVAPRSEVSYSVCILCVSLSELLLGVVAPRS